MSSQYPDDSAAAWRGDEEDAGPGLPAFLLDPRGVFERRWKVMLGCLVVGLVATVLAFAIRTPTYRAQANILISSQEMPEAFVRSTVREDTIANINAMVGRVLSETNLTRLLDDHDLYGGRESGKSLSWLLGNLRSNIEIAPETKSRSRGKQTALVYAIAFSYPEREIAASVANELAAFFVEASLARRQARAERATEFLQNELARDEAALNVQAGKVTEFRQQNRGQLPDELETNLRKAEMLNSEKESLNTQIAQRQNRLVTLASSPQAVVATGNQELLSELRRQLATELAANTEEHPNVVALRRRIASQEQAVAAERNAPTGASSELAALRRAEEAEIQLLRDRLTKIDERLVDLNQRIERTPRVAEDLLALEQKEQVLRDDYLNTLRKVKEAELAENLESAQQGGQVAILDRARPPAAPEQPLWIVLVAGLVGTIALAVGTAGLLELIDPVIVSADQLNRVTEHPVLGSLPEIA